MCFAFPKLAKRCNTCQLLRRLIACCMQEVVALHLRGMCMGRGLWVSAHVHARERERERERDCVETITL
jgi:hypothetical protein